MTDQYFERMALQAMNVYKLLSPEELKRQIILVMKEVERDTRHRAAEIAMSNHSEIMNMRIK